ncbi:MAG: hypothetical protein LUI14_01485 [Lachnospiraceae bacterium]|nr:hypothetical protein [Lachnospiraceae bacterium]
MTVEDIIAYYYDEVKESAEYDAYAETLYQEAQCMPALQTSKYNYERTKHYE